MVRNGIPKRTYPNYVSFRAFLGPKFQDASGRAPARSTHQIGRNHNQSAKQGGGSQRQSSSGRATPKPTPSYIFQCCTTITSKAPCARDGGGAVDPRAGGGGVGGGGGSSNSSSSEGGRVSCVHSKAGDQFEQDGVDSGLSASRHASSSRRRRSQ